MKKHIITSFLFLCAILTQAQWQQDVRLTNNNDSSLTSLNNAWCIASSGNYVHVVWFDTRDGNEEIYYKRSTDEGVSWGADIRLTNNPYNSSYPSVAVSGQDVRVVWQDRRIDNRYQLYYKRSTDGGLNWGVDTRLTNDFGESGYPSVAVSGSTTHLIWYRYGEGDGSWEIYYKRSLDGTNWSADTRLTANDSTYSGMPSIAVSNSPQGGVIVVWHDRRDGDYEIYYKRSVNGGTTWEADVRLTNNTEDSMGPSICVSPLGEVHVVWRDKRDGNFEIYYKRSGDGGMNWGEDIRLTNGNSSSTYPSVAVSDSLQGRVHVVWMEGGTYADIYYKRSTDGGMNWGVETPLIYTPSQSSNPSISGFSRGGAQIVWRDNRDGNYEIYYKRDLTGTTGIEDIISEVPNRIELEQNYPNPFNPSTKISWQSPVGNRQTLKIYDVLGNEVSALVDEYKPAGIYEVEFDGGELASGVYFYQLKTGDYLETKKMLLIK